MERPCRAEGTAGVRAEATEVGLGSGPRWREVWLEHVGCLKAGWQDGRLEREVESSWFLKTQRPPSVLISL